MELRKKVESAKEAAYWMMTANSIIKDKALTSMAQDLIENKDEIIKANQKDLLSAQKKGMSIAMQDRLRLDDSRIKSMAEGLVNLSLLPDPVGGADEMIKRPNGLLITKRRVPLGVIGMIYEARPNVTVDAVGICLKAGNTVILRGGSEAINSNIAIVKVLKEAMIRTGLPAGCVALIENTKREIALEMMKMVNGIDVLIPRGSKKLIRTVVDNATVPVIETGSGNCHIYVDNDADLVMAQNIVINAKCSRPSVCNSMEKLILHKNIANEFLQRIDESLYLKGVEIRGDFDVLQILPNATLVTEEDWYTEYSDYIMAVKIVSNYDEAVAHINKYNTKHSEAIITKDYKKAQKFMDQIDAAVVYVNASTRFTDGEEFGFGAEIGISTQKLHARGPMGLREMTTYKYCINGNGQIR